MFKERLRKLPEYVGGAVAMIRIEKGAGWTKKVDLEKRIMLFFFCKADEQIKGCRGTSWAV